jgi:hypothetical protein
MIEAPGADAGAADLAGGRVVRDPAAPAARGQQVTVTARTVNPAVLPHQARARTRSPALLTTVPAWRPLEPDRDCPGPRSLPSPGQSRAREVMHPTHRVLPPTGRR